MQHDVINCAKQVESLETQLASRMEQLQATVQSKTAVPTAQVYVRELGSTDGGDNDDDNEMLLIFTLFLFLRAHMVTT